MRKATKYILGNKVGMTHLFDGRGRQMPVTVIEAKPCVVTFVRTAQQDGYDAVQIGCGHRKRMRRPEQGHFKTLGPFAVVREFRTGGAHEREVGDMIDVSQFSEGERVSATGTTKAKGFQGVVKRHSFAGGPKSHGQKHSLREPGSIGATWPQRVLKGKRMPGRMGGERRTVSGLEIVKVDKEQHLLAVRGAVPGRKGAWVELTG